MNIRFQECNKKKEDPLHLLRFKNTDRGMFLLPTFTIEDQEELIFREDHVSPHDIESSITVVYKYSTQTLPVRRVFVAHISFPQIVIGEHDLVIYLWGTTVRTEVGMESFVGRGVILPYEYHPRESEPRISNSSVLEINRLFDLIIGEETATNLRERVREQKT